mmetsp:Transcript_71362/g.201267  ORF Transcript_71362/g.201267 Transcript_71362/m.201267 type:complete len:161 (+) Transcript_71362:253-735(+)
MAANGSSAGPTDGAAAAAAAEEFDLDFDDIPATPPPPPVIEEGEEWLTPGESTDFQNDPSGLVGKCVEVEGLGVGTVEGFNKAHNKLLYDSKHVVEFSSGPQTILLRRRKMGKWNGGLNFKVSRGRGLGLREPRCTALRRGAVRYGVVVWRGVVRCGVLW